MKTQYLKLFARSLLLVFSVFFVIACNLFTTRVIPFPTVTATPVIILPSITTTPTQIPTDTPTEPPTVTTGPTQAPTETSAPTDTLEPPPPPPPPTQNLAAGLTRINFAQGTTSAVIEGQVKGKAIKGFILGAAKGQVMMVSVDTPKQDVYLEIYPLGGLPYMSFAGKLTGWEGSLPATEDYVIRIYASNKTTNYNLSVIIPQRITFNPGGTSATVKGKAPNAVVITYVLRAKADQKMNVTISSAADSVLLTIYGFDDGQPLVRSVTGATSWTGKLPGTQDYIIEAVGTSGGAGNYTLIVTVK